MKIERINVGGFKNIKNIDLKLDNITSLLSVNSYGKSNTLNAITFGIKFINNPFKEFLMEEISNKPFNNKIFLNDFKFEIEFQVDITRIIYGYSFSWGKEEKKSKIKKEYLKIKNGNSQKYTLFINRNEKEIVYKSSKTSGCSKKIKVSTNELVINKLLAFDELYYLDIIKEINNLKILVDSNFNPESEHNPRRRNQRTNTPFNLYKIKTNYPDKYELIVNTLKDIFPFIEDIDVKEIYLNRDDDEDEKYNYITEKLYFINIYDKNIAKPLDLREMSDGVRRILLILITLVLGNINNYNLICIEEPENSLNPRVLQRYLIALKSFANETKIIITSHSPHLINYFDPKSIYIGLPNDDGLAIFSKIKDGSVSKLLNDSNDMDLQVGDYIFDLMSGTKEDMKTILKYVE